MGTDMRLTDQEDGGMRINASPILEINQRKPVLEKKQSCTSPRTPTRSHTILPSRLAPSQNKPLLKQHEGDGIVPPSSKLEHVDVGSILEAQDSERRRIARELHDEFGQVLTGLKFDLTWLRKRLVQRSRTVKSSSLIKKTDSIVASVDALMASIRNTATSLHPSILDDLGLLPALEWLAGDFQARTNIRCTTVIDPALSDTQMTVESSTALYRIIQELLTNVARHAQASRVNISLFERAGELVLELVDNGKGIDRHQMKQRGSLGLRGIRDRVSLLNGTMTIVGEPGLGTTVSITLAYAAIVGKGPVPMQKHPHSHTGTSLPNEK